MRGVKLASIALFSVGLTASGTPGEAATLRRTKLASATLEATEPTLAPLAHIVFCKNYPEDCRKPEIPNAGIDDDPSALELIREVNADVNASIRPRRDRPGPLSDVWTLAPAAGDCDDFAVTKRHRLLARGLPAASLRLAVTRTAAGEGHAVLVVSTAAGERVLDNRTDTIRSWRESGLSLLKLQSADDPRLWMSPAPSLVSAE